MERLEKTTQLSQALHTYGALLTSTKEMETGLNSNNVI